jgi:anti-sigma factor RsiW
MNDQSEHIDFEVLNDYADGLLDQRAAQAVSHHISTCSACSKQLADLQHVLRSAADLPRSVLPADDIWADLKLSLEQRKEAVLPVPGTTPASGLKSGPSPRSRWQARGALAAAAVILVVLSSGITALVLRDYFLKQIARSIPTQPVPTLAQPVIPVSFRLAEGEYNRAIMELVQAVNAQRNRLSPETIRTVDHSLAVIDSAIAEARTALVADPNNANLVDLLSASYQRKLDLLRRTSELSSRS